jgi:hypothetical protein
MLLIRLYPERQEATLQLSKTNPVPCELQLLDPVAAVLFNFSAEQSPVPDGANGVQICWLQELLTFT